jgi:hypothetical protein
MGTQANDPFGQVEKPSLWALAGVGLAAFALQIQVVIGRTEDYLGLRVNIADFLLALSGIGILISLFRKKSVWPRWNISYGDAGLAGLTLVMVGAFLNGWLVTGEWSEWALLNRLLGWFILLGYIYGAAWAVTQYGSEVVAFFIRWSAVSFCLFQIGGFAVLVLQDGGVLPWSFGGIKEPFSALMGNRNAYALYEVAVLSGMSFLGLSSSSSKWKKFDGAVAALLWTMVPFFLMFNGSRAGMGAVALVAIALVALTRGAAFRRYAAFFLLGWALVFSHLAATKTSFFRDRQIEVTGQLLSLGEKSAENAPQYQGDQLRIMTVTDALDLWREYPVRGAGLGTFFEYQKEKYGELVETIDCTPVWLLCETGLIGFLMFLAGFALAGKSFWTTSRDGPDAWIGRAGITFLLGFCFMALFHQMLFARILWVLMGLFLARHAHASLGRASIA